MKKTIIAVALLLSGFVFQSASAQLRVRLNVNISSQPVWGPVGYDHVEYYYMPDIDAFYYVPAHQYIYQDRGRWIITTSLPYRFHDYDFNNGYKVVVNEPRPYYHVDTYRTRYASYKGNHSQGAIRNSHDPRYFEIKDHPEHNKWRNGNQGNNGNHGNNGNRRNNGHHN
jgi:hypothetical protein